MTSFNHFLKAENSSYFHRNDFNGRLVLKNQSICLQKIPGFFQLFWRAEALRKENKEVWSVFQKEISGQSPEVQKKIENIFKKYSVDVEVLSQGAFLEKRHIDMVLVALSTMQIGDLGSAEPFKLTPQEVSSKIQSFLKTVPLGPSFQIQKTGRLYDILLADPVFLEKERIFSIYKLARLRTLPEYWECLTREVVSRDLEEGMVLPAPEGNDFYYVYKKINKDGLVAYALKPISEESKWKPIICFRPTQMNLTAVDEAMETLLDDLHETGVGYGGFQSARKPLDDLMKDPLFRSENEKIIVAGYSLGGAYAQYFVARQDNWKHVSEAVFFNDPGVDQATAYRFARKVNQIDAKAEEAPLLSLFRTKGDFADHHGELHLGSGVSPQSNVEIKLNLLIPRKFDTRLDRHFRCYLQEGIKGQCFDLKDPKYHHLLDNSKRGDKVQFWESLRKWAGCFLRPLVFLFVTCSLLWKKTFNLFSLTSESSKAFSSIG